MKLKVERRHFNFKYKQPWKVLHFNKLVVDFLFHLDIPTDLGTRTSEIILVVTKHKTNSNLPELSTLFRTFFVYIIFLKSLRK